MTATFLVPCTKEFYNLTKMVLKHTPIGLCTVLRKLKTGTKSTMRAVSNNARKVPQIINNVNIMITTVFQEVSQAMIDFSEHVAQGFIDFIRGANSRGMKALKIAVQTLTSVFENTTKAVVEFGEHVVQGSVDFARGTKSWGITIATHTYNNILVPMILNITSFTAQIMQNISAFFENLTVFLYRFLSSFTQDAIHFITDVSIDVAERVQYYSMLWTKVCLSTMKTSFKGVAQTVVNIPMWITEIADVTFEYMLLVQSQTKKCVIQVYEDSIELLEKMIDVAPFLIRYEEDGQDKISLTPTAQMALYMLSTVYATQPLWEQNRSGSVFCDMRRLFL